MSSIKDDPLKFIYRVMDIIGHADMRDDLFWNTSGPYAPLSFFIMCNDQFYWATADLEPLTPDNLVELVAAIDDATTAGGRVGAIVWAGALFCSRMRKMRPQTPMYKRIDERLRPLFDACGPERTDA